MAVASSSQIDSQQAKSAERWITQALEVDERVVTFRELARAVGCHIHSAKNLLQQYLSTHPSTTATFLVSGPLLITSSLERTEAKNDSGGGATQSLAHLSATQKVRIVDMDQMSDDERNSEADDEEERREIELEEEAKREEADADGFDVDAESRNEVARWGVVLVGEDGLAEKKRLFASGQASIHVYALSPSRVKDPTTFFAAAQAIRERPNYANPEVYGTILGDSLCGPAAAKPMRDGKMDFNVSKKDDKGKQGLPVQQPDIKPVKSAMSRSNAIQQKSSSQASVKNRRRIITSDDEDDDAQPPPGTRSSKSPSSRSGSSKTPLEPTSSVVRANDQAAMEAMMTMDFDDDMDSDLTPVKVESGSKSAPSPVVVKGNTKRKRRRVKKSKTEMDDKGYMVTKDYWTDESYSGASETETESPPTKSKPTTSSKSSSTKPDFKAAVKKESSSAGSVPRQAKKGTGAGKKQSTLAGFFQKK